ncbi:unnamed protein product [Dibothriocephalus latus]|uniref:Jumonji helical domain-containing protein n=1 Tax=Dibothriocephalus latus TaxID=60516 RepID=A0A3P7MP29_DIBLA|nr:unnamed protein product [Dibothriocephalus latus]
MEQKQGTAQRFLFPFFEKLHWYASDLLLGRLKSESFPFSPFYFFNARSHSPPDERKQPFHCSSRVGI